MNRYQELKSRQQKDVNDFPMFFAFNNEQFEKGMRKLGLEPTDTGAVYRLGHTGGFYRKSDSQALKDMFDRHSNEMEQAIEEDNDEKGFIYDMFLYELANHEYCITYEAEPTLEACGLTWEDLEENPKLMSGFKLAKKDYLASYE